ncbi:hypothetical protein BAU15_02570 [Enterococcus sp. JM4C]|uniref:hypothetical protein n=1 Tax=Candidatus Enterococcus huntleyi TaxID=1857217 RepID=UPI00137960DD|nr:hypothetical protein [Enterococcus sp. JM4C]KAF1299546.1 hypothetical protein BAU15_02570 [Enterococcus sp. JM4C]
MEIIQKALIELVRSRKKLTGLLPRLKENKQISAKEEMKTFVFDLQDYSDALTVVTDFAEADFAEESDSVTPQEISQLFSEQRQELQTLVSEFTQLADQMETGESTEGFHGLNAGSIRRMAGSLQGLIEMNGQLLQENLNFQRFIKDVSISEAIPTEEVVEEKTGFFKKLFGK